MDLNSLGGDVRDPAENIPPDKGRQTTKSRIGTLLHAACFNEHVSPRPDSNNDEISNSNRQATSSMCKLHKNTNMILSVEDLPSIDVKNLQNPNPMQDHSARISVLDSNSNMDHEELSDEDFQLVQKKRKIASSNKKAKVDLSNVEFSIPKNVPGTSTSPSNRFALLGDLDVKSNSSLHKTAPLKNTANVEKPNGNKKSFCPPIFLFGVDMQSLIKDLEARNIVFKIVNKNRLKSKLYLQDTQVHTELMSLLREKKLDSYSFTPKEMKRQSMVLRGLLYESNVEDIKADIDRLVPDTIDNVSKFTTSFSRKNNVDTGLFLVTLLPGKSVSELKCQRYILKQLITWELPRRNLGDVRCWRCQKWGHMSKNCNRESACVKCDQNHARGECQFVQTESNLPYCVNCGNHGHPASFRGCSEYKKYVELKNRARKVAKEGKEKANTNVLNAFNSIIRPNVSFSDASRGVINARSQIPSPKPKIIEEFLKIANEICPPKTIALENKIATFLREFKSISKDEAIQQCISLLREVNEVYGP